MEWSVKSEQTPGSFWKVFLQIGDEKFDIAFLAINQKDAEEFKDHLVKALYSIGVKEKIQKPISDSYNLHADCKEADEYARKHGKLWAEHCNDSSCDDHQ